MARVRKRLLKEAAAADWWLLLLLRVVHIGAAMVWFSGAIIGGFFLNPTVVALGDSAQPFMDHLMRRQRMGIMFPVGGTAAIVSSALGFVLVAPSVGEQTTVRNELARGGPPSAAQLERLEHADRLMRLAGRVDLPPRLGGDRDKVVTACAAAEPRGDVKRASNVSRMAPEGHARRPYADGVKKVSMR